MEHRTGKKIGEQKLKATCLKCGNEITKGPWYASMDGRGWLDERCYMKSKKPVYL